MTIINMVGGGTGGDLNNVFFKNAFFSVKASSYGTATETPTPAGEPVEVARLEGYDGDVPRFTHTMFKSGASTPTCLSYYLIHDEGAIGSARSWEPVAKTTTVFDFKLSVDKMVGLSKYIGIPDGMYDIEIAMVYRETRYEMFFDSDPKPHVLRVNVVNRTAQIMNIDGKSTGDITMYFSGNLTSNNLEFVPLSFKKL